MTSALRHNEIKYFHAQIRSRPLHYRDVAANDVRSPSDKATETDDGYLSASEIATLKLDADWVILSACNTAAGSAEGAEALSGLARAFFYAGTRALLVSH